MNGRLAVVAVILLAAGTAAGAADSARVAGSRIPGGIRRYAEQWIIRHDTDRDGQLAAAEWRPLGEYLQEADADQDEVLTGEELAWYLAEYGRHRRIRLMPAADRGAGPLPSLLRPGEGDAGRPPAREDAGGEDPPEEAVAEKQAAREDEGESKSAELPARKYHVAPSRLPAGLPDWFQKCDRDGDGQLTLAEYAQHGSASAEQEFARYDRNRDGLVTPQEVLGPASKR
jgi:hypothetical protein